jgi:sugar phosphate isomerase/epimerase
MVYSFGPAIASSEMSQRDAIDLCAELGLVCVDTMDGLTSEPWTDVRQMVEDAGLLVATHITSANLATPDASERQEAMNKVRGSIEDTVTLASDKLMVVTGLITEGDTREVTQQRVGQALRTLAAEAEDAGVQLCIEDFPGHSSPHRTAAEVLAICAIAGERLGVCFDTGNFYAGGETPQEAWPILASKTIHSHVKDWCWAEDGRHATPDGRRFSPELVGRGFIDYPAVFAAMKSSGYEGVLSFEYEGPRDRADSAREGIAYLRSVLESV